MCGFKPEITSDTTNRLDRLCIRRVAGEKHVEISEVGLAKASVDVADLLGRGLGAFDLAISGVVACHMLWVGSKESW